MKNYQVLQEALDKATQKGAFTLQETGYIMGALKGVHEDLQEFQKLQEAVLAAKEPQSNEELVTKPKK